MCVNHRKRCGAAVNRRRNVWKNPTRQPKKGTAMKKTEQAPRKCELTDDEIRDYAYHLYEQSGRIPDRDLDNWLEAKACLLACVPPHASHQRLHRHLNSPSPANHPAA